MDSTQVSAAEAEFAHVAAQEATSVLIELDKRVVIGQIDGGVMFWGTCMCFYGVLAQLNMEMVGSAKGFRIARNRRNGMKLAASEQSPLEEQIINIQPGDTPATNEASAWLHGLLQAEIARRATP